LISWVLEFESAAFRGQDYSLGSREIPIVAAGLVRVVGHEAAVGRKARPVLVGGGLQENRCLRTAVGRHGKWQVSVNGGRDPIWGRDGKRLYHVSAGTQIRGIFVVENWLAEFKD